MKERRQRLLNERNSLMDELSELQDERDQKIESYISNEIDNILGHNDKIKFKQNSINFLRFSEDYFKELFTIYLNPTHKNLFQSDGKYYFERGGEQINYYMTTAETDFEFDRLITLGKVAEYVKSGMNDIVDFINKTFNEYEDFLDSLEFQIRQLESDYQEMDDIQEIKKLEYMYNRAKREGGIDVSLEGRGITFWRTQNDEIKRVINFEIIKQSSSGKTFTIKLTRLLWNHFNDDTKEEIQTVKAKKEYVTKFLKQLI